MAKLLPGVILHFILHPSHHCILIEPHGLNHFVGISPRINMYNWLLGQWQRESWINSRKKDDHCSKLTKLNVFSNLNGEIWFDTQYPDFIWSTAMSIAIRIDVGPTDSCVDIFHHNWMDIILQVVGCRIQWNCF
jgi:hypothetical protein